MKVILQKDMKNLGKAGDIVTVAEGYGRNYLLPKGIASEATDGNLKQQEAVKKAESNKRQRLYEEAQQIAKKIEGQTLQLVGKVGESGKLFGSITAQDIAERLAKQYKVEIDKRKVVIDDPIKSVGKFDITLKLHPKVQAAITVLVKEG